MKKNKRKQSVAAIAIIAFCFLFFILPNAIGLTKMVYILTTYTEKIGIVETISNVKEIEDTLSKGSNIITYADIQIMFEDNETIVLENTRLYFDKKDIVQNQSISVYTNGNRYELEQNIHSRIKNCVIILIVYTLFLSLGIASHISQKKKQQ